MKTQHLFMLFLAILALKARAHDYQTVYANQTALFNNSSKDQIKGLRVDSVKVAAADTILYPFATIQEVSAGCISPYKASWIGENVVIKPDFSNLFFNRDGDTIILKTNARLNETWIAFQRADTFRVEARVQAAELGTVLGISDSVKTIAFRLLDQQGNTVDHALNKLKVKISKMHGFVETLNFYLFPDIVASYPDKILMSYTLVGLTNHRLGIQNLTWFDVNGFNPGDELNVQEHNIGDPNFFLPVREYDNRCIYKYLERTNYADSIVYRYARKQSIKTVYTDSTTLVTYNDTVRSVVLANPGFDKLPGEPIFQGNSAQQMYMRNDEFLTKIRPSAMNELYVYSGNGDCWSEIAGEGCLPEIRYIDGLGGPYYQCRGYIGESEERKLVYYKKGETEWGEKLVITGVRNIKTYAGLQVFPNPARNVVTFQLNDDAGTHEIRIYNQNGSLVKTEQFKGSTCKIKLAGFKSGIYFYRLTSSTSTEYSGKLVVD
ncbi:MAG: T9SS type A sorting domain-containing protein [Bacteroidota bacterium]|nr:T9SS type A sorting domain-containing protein [Bacteroidota bacterium]